MTLLFNSIDKLYEYLELSADNYDELYEIAQLFNQLQGTDKYSKEDLLKIELEKSIFYSICESKYSKENKKKLPDLILNNLQSIEERFNNSNNLVLQATYAEILFLSEAEVYRHYVSRVTQAYNNLMPVYYAKDCQNPEKHFAFLLIESAQKALKYGMMCKSKLLSSIKSEILKILFEYPVESSSSGMLCIDLLQLILDYPKIFKTKDFERIDSILWNVASYYSKNANHTLAANILSLGPKIDNKIGKPSYDWDFQIGLCYEGQMKSFPDGQASIYWCAKAIEHYNSINKVGKKITELEKVYIETKNKIALGSFGQDFDSKPFIDPADEVLKYNPITILRLLANNESFYPEEALLSKTFNEIQEFISTSYLDANLHTSKILDINSKSERLLSNYDRIWQIYQITIQKILFESIVQEKITLQVLINYLLDYSWFFNLYKKPIGNGKYIKYNYSKAFISIFEKYFTEVLRYNQDPEKFYPDLITITDSLVLKFEGMLRIYLELWNQPSFKNIPQEPGVIREKDINLLLYDDFIIEKLTFNDLLFFRYLFIAKQGRNLRNNIAHSLLIPEQYTIELFNLVFFAFLRLSKYKIKIS